MKDFESIIILHSKWLFGNHQCGLKRPEQFEAIPHSKTSFVCLSHLLLSSANFLLVAASKCNFNLSSDCIKYWNMIYWRMHHEGYRWPAVSILHTPYIQNSFLLVQSWQLKKLRGNPLDLLRSEKFLT